MQQLKISLPDIASEAIKRDSERLGMSTSEVVRLVILTHYRLIQAQVLPKARAPREPANGGPPREGDMWCRVCGDGFTYDPHTQTEFCPTCEPERLPKDLRR